jgi:NAD(P)-dependent dehydrogenase (short-subunit alcohol dehydrogenase family)
MLGAGVRAAYTAAHLGVPLMLPQGRGLVVAPTVDWPPERHDGRAVYALAKTATNRLVWGLAQDLRPHGLAAVALAPVGFGGAVTSGEELAALRAAARTPGARRPCCGRSPAWPRRRRRSTPGGRWRP